MSAAKHSPAPWRYEFEQGFCGAIIAADGSEVAAFIEEPNEHDAPVLAASAELLAALREFVPEHQSGTLTETERIAKARAAIAKATEGAA